MTELSIKSSFWKFLKSFMKIRKIIDKTSNILHIKSKQTTNFCHQKRRFKTIFFIWKVFKRHINNDNKSIIIKFSKTFKSFDFSFLIHFTIESNLLNITFDNNNLENSIEFVNDSSNTIINSTHRNQKHTETQSKWTNVFQNEWTNFQETI